MAERLVSIEELFKQAEDLDSRKHAFGRTVERIKKRFSVLAWDVVELATWERFKPTFAHSLSEVLEEVLRQLAINLQQATKLSQELEESNEAFNGVPVSPRLIDEAKTGLPDKIQTLRLNTEKYLKSSIGLLDSHRLLHDTLGQFEARLAEKAYVVEFMAPDVCRLTYEEWTNLRDEMHVEQSLLWQLLEELQDKDVDTKFTKTRNAFDVFVTSLRAITPTLASQCSAVHLFEAQLSQLSELSLNYCKQAQHLQNGLEAQVNKGDLYHTALDMCSKRLDAIETDLGQLLSSSSLGGEMRSWTAATQDLVCKLVVLEGRLCDFQTKELEDLLMISSNDGEFLPLAAQAVQDRWSELVTRAMNARSSAETAVSAIQSTSEAFRDMLQWINEAVHRLSLVIKPNCVLPSEFDLEKAKPQYAVEVWNGLIESRSTRLSKISVCHLNVTLFNIQISTFN